MENVDMTIKDNILTIKIDLSVDLGLSKSEKSRVVATTRGNARILDTDTMIGLNIYKKV